MLLSIIYFFVVIFGLGYSITSVFKVGFRDSYEYVFMNLGIGLGTFTVIASILSITSIPLHWGIFIVLALIIPIKHIIFKKIKLPKVTHNNHAFTATIISFILLVVFVMGAFSYEWLEDDDPVIHATGAKYISEKMTANEPEGLNYQYLDPYPPAFDILMGILHQTNNSIVNTLKFFNALLCALAIIFFYFFAERFTESKSRALTATFVLACLPCFMSHFIWAQSLGISLMMVALYCLSRRLYWVGSLMVAAIFLSQPSTAAIFLLMGLLYCLGPLITTNYKESLLALGTIVTGGLIASIYWVTMFFRYSFMGTLAKIGFSIGKFSNSNIDTSGGIVYGIQDFLVAPLATRIDQPIGIGIVAFLCLILVLVLLITGLLTHKGIRKNKHIIISLIWLVFTFVGVMGNALPVKLFPHRFFVFFSIPVALLVGEFIYSTMSLIKEKNRFASIAFVAVIVFGIGLTSAYPKMVVNSSTWGPGVHFTSQEELQGFIWLKELPADTKVFSYNMENKGIVISFDKYTCMWCDSDREFRENLINKTPDDLYSFLKENKYEYLIISGRGPYIMTNEFGANKTNQHMDALFRNIQTNPNYTLAFQNNGAIIMEVI